MDRDDLELFATSIGQATERRRGTDLDAELSAVGWHDALDDDPHAAIATLFELQGRHTATSAALDHVFLHGLGLDRRADTTPVWPAFDEWTPPGSLTRAGVAVRGLAGASMRTARRALVVAEADGKFVALSIDVGELDLNPRRGVDEGAGLIEVTAAGVRTDGEAEPIPWDDALALCQLAVAHELQGASRTMLELARTHALERVQFGRTIGSFQAVRHRLAETLIAIETAEAMLDAAWADRTSVNASMAKALAGRNARTVARHCQQVLAGIGFTTEHPFHESLRRVLVLDHLFGGSRGLTKELGTSILRTRRLPTPQAL